eukprot:UN04325
MISFPDSLELECTSRARFQFELENLPQVIFLLSRIDDATVQFQAYLRQVVIMDQQYKAKAGESITITFPQDVLTKIRADIAAEANKAAAPAAPTTTPAPKQQKEKKQPAPKAAPAAKPAAAAKDKKEPVVITIAAAKPAATTTTTEKKTTTPTTAARRQRNENKPLVQNPQQQEIGRSYTAELAQLRGVRPPAMQWPSTNAVEPTKMWRLYSEIINTTFYPLSSQFTKYDPLKLFQFYLYKSNIAVSLLPLDLNSDKYKNVEAIKSKVYRHIFAIKNYEQNLHKYDAVHAEENANKPKPNQYTVKTIDAEKKLLTQMKPDMIKLIRIGVPSNATIPQLKMLYSCKSYANSLGINFLLDRLEVTDAAPKKKAAAPKRKLQQRLHQQLQQHQQQQKKQHQKQKHNK